MEICDGNESRQCGLTEIMQKMHTHTHTHTHTVQTDGNEGQCLELTFEGRESSRAPDVLEEIVPDVRAKA